MLAAASGETAQAFAVTQLDVDHAPGLVWTEGPSRTGRGAVDAHLGGRIFQHQLQFADGGAAPDGREVGPVHPAAALDHVARGALALAEEKSLSGRDIACGLAVEGRHV